MGVTLDVGEFPNHTPDESGETSDPTRLHRLTAHAVARVADRLGPVRKLSRHFEGKERRAGLASDIVAALWELYKRNPEAVEKLGAEVFAGVKTRQEQRSQSANGAGPGTQTQPVGGYTT